MEICSRVIPNGLVWLAVPYTSCPLQLLHISWQQEVGDSTPHCKWPSCANNGIQSAPGHHYNDTIMLHSTGSHQIRLLLYICTDRILYKYSILCIYVIVIARLVCDMAQTQHEGKMTLYV